MELDAIIEESMALAEQEFYNKKFEFSYSSLNKLLWNPQSFYQTYVLGNREERDDAHLVNGKVIHALLLEENKFNDNFIVSPSTLPTGNQKKVIDAVFKHYQELSRNGDERTSLDQFELAVIDVMKDLNYHQSLKTDKQRIEKVLTPDAYNYWAFLQMKGKKTLVDQESVDFCKTAVEIVKLNKQVCELIGCNATDFDNKEIFNEIALNCSVNDMPFGLKAVIDNLVFDNDKKIVYINDIKTTSKELKDFPETVEFYNYWLQAAIYTSIVATQHFEKFEAGWKIQFNFVVIDKYFQVYPFPVSHATLDEWITKLTEVLEVAQWHYNNKQFDLPYQFANGLVTL